VQRVAHLGLGRRHAGRLTTVTVHRGGQFDDDSTPLQVGAGCCRARSPSGLPRTTSRRCAMHCTSRPQCRAEVGPRGETSHGRGQFCLGPVGRQSQGHDSERVAHGQTRLWQICHNRSRRHRTSTSRPRSRRSRVHPRRGTWQRRRPVPPVEEWRSSSGWNRKRLTARTGDGQVAQFLDAHVKWMVRFDLTTAWSRCCPLSRRS